MKKNLYVDLRSNLETVTRYALNNLLPWAHQKNDTDAILDMISIAGDMGMPDVLRFIKAKAPGLEPYHAQLVEQAFHKFDNICGAALECIQRSNPTNEFENFAGELMKETIRRKPNYRTWYFLEGAHRRGIDLTPVLPLLARTVCAIGPGEEKFSHPITLAKELARHDPRCAQALLEALKNAPRPLDSRRVGSLKRIANATIRKHS